MDITETTNFALPKGNRETDRLEPELVKALVDCLEGQTFTYNGQLCTISRFGDKGVDVRGVDGFDHIEFCITKTGWGRNK